MSRAELIDLASGERFPLANSVTVGREGCDIALNDDAVSRRHAAIQVTAGGLEIEDLGSTNGTYVNGEPLVAARALQPGDTVEIGAVRLRVERVSAAVTKPSPVAAGSPAALAEPRGDVPAPEPQSSASVGPEPGGMPGLERSRSRTARPRGSAARRGGATAASLALIAATAAALIAYFADRGL